MPNRKLIFLLSVLLAGGVATPGHAAKIYKWTDEHGNVSYHDRPPPGDAGKVEEKDIDPDRNVIKTTPPSTSKTPAADKGRLAGGKGSQKDKSNRDSDRKRRGLEAGAAEEEERAEREEREERAEGNAGDTPVAPGPSATPGPAVPEPPPPPAPPTPGSGVTPGPAVPGAPPPTPGPGGF